MTLFGSFEWHLYSKKTAICGASWPSLIFIPLSPLSLLHELSQEDFFYSIALKLRLTKNAIFGYLEPIGLILESIVARAY